MAVTLFMRVPELSPERYDRLMAELALDASPPAGLIFHQASECVGAINVSEIWQSRKAAERFVERTLRDALARQGVKDPLSFRIEPLRNLFVPGLDAVERIGASSRPGARNSRVS